MSFKLAKKVLVANLQVLHYICNAVTVLVMCNAAVQVAVYKHELSCGYVLCCGCFMYTSMPLL